MLSENSAAAACSLSGTLPSSFEFAPDLPEIESHLIDVLTQTTLTEQNRLHDSVHDLSGISRDWDTDSQFLANLFCLPENDF